MCTWRPIQHRKHFTLGTGKGDARFAATLLAQYRRVTQKVTGPFLSSHGCLRLVVGLLLCRSRSLKNKEPVERTMTEE